VKSLSLNNARIEALVEQLYDINKRLNGLKAACCAWPKATASARGVPEGIFQATSSIPTG
jgi:hypothetical protein